MSKPQLHVLATDPIALKVEKITRFLGEHFFTPGGIMYSMWHWEGDDLRPFEPRDFDGMSTLKIKAGTPMWDLYMYENSPMTAGDFLWSQVLRYKLTKEDEALRYAAKAFRSLELILELSQANGERGLLCKPYGLKFTRETSPDQYVPVILGLWEYRDIVDDKTRAKIDRMIPIMADWW